MTEIVGTAGAALSDEDGTFVPVPVLAPNDLSSTITDAPSRRAESTSASAASRTSFRTLGSGALLYALSSVLSRAVSFVMLPVYTRYLTPVDYGLIQLLDMTIDIVGMLFTAGITSGLQRFYFKASTEDERRAIVSTTFAFELGMALIGTVLLLGVAPLVWRRGLHGAGSILLVRVAALNFSLAILTRLPQQLLEIRQKASASVVISVSRLICQLTLNIVFVVGLKKGALGILLSTCLTHIIFGLPLCIWLLREVGIAFRRTIIRELRRFGVPYQLAFAGSFIATFGDRFFLQAYHGAAEVGRYGLAYQFGFILAMLTYAPFQSAWLPQRHQLVNASREERDRATARAFFFVNLLMFTGLVGISLFVGLIFRVMTTPPFYAAAGPVPIILAAYVIQSWAYAMGFSIDVREETRYFNYATWICAIVTAIGYFLLIPRWSSYGAAWATLIGFSTRFLLTWYWGQRLFPVHYGWRKPLELAAIAVVVIIAARLMRPETLLAQLAVAITGCSLFGALVWWQVLQASDRELVFRSLRSPRLAFRLFTA
jgi:O-antigen/teichoic acid export membrane protein